MCVFVFITWSARCAEAGLPTLSTYTMDIEALEREITADKSHGTFLVTLLL